MKTQNPGSAKDPAAVADRHPVADPRAPARPVRPRRWWRTGLACAALVAVAGTGVSAAVAAELYRADRAASAVAVDHRVELARQAVADEVQRYVDAVALTAAAVGAQPDLTDSRYQELTRPLVDARLPGATAVAFAVPATDDQVAATQARWRTRGL